MTGARISRVHAIQHSAPAVAGGPARPRGASSFRVHLHADVSGDEFSGTGEAQVADGISGDDQRAAWSALTTACKRLTYKQVDLDGDLDAVATLVPATDAALDDAALDAVRTALREAFVDLRAAVRQEPRAAGHVPYEGVLAHVKRHYWNPVPAPIRDPEGRRANVYEMGLYQGFKQLGEANPAIQEAAIAHGLSTLRVGLKDFTATDGNGRSVAFGLAMSDSASSVPGVLTENKQLTRHLLERAGAPTPRGRSFRPSEVDEAVAYAASIGFPVVVKPLAGFGGAGVITDVADADGVRDAIELMRAVPAGRGTFIVERHIPGADHRVYVAYGEVLSVVVRRPASVIGDGERTVAELVLAKNHLRSQNPYVRNSPIRVDQAAERNLAKQGLHWDAVVPVGTHVVLAWAANIEQGGDSTEVLRETHPSILQASVDAVGAIPGLHQAGVDFILADHRRPLADQAAAICEINSTPAVMNNGAVLFGRPEPVIDRLLHLAAAERGLQLSARQDTVQVAFDVDGVHDRRRFGHWLTRRARRLDVGGRVAPDGIMGMSGVLGGRSAAVAMLVASVFGGRHAERPVLARTVPFSGEVPEIFEVSNDQ